MWVVKLLKYYNIYVHVYAVMFLGYKIQTVDTYGFTVGIKLIFNIPYDYTLVKISILLSLLLTNRNLYIYFIYLSTNVRFTYLYLTRGRVMKLR